MGIYADRLLLEQKQDQAFIQAINEVYFGRTPSINRVFNAFCDWREPFISNTKYYTTTTFKNMYNKDMEVFRNEVCRQFGFKSFSYNVLPIAVINSFTFGGGPAEFITRNPASIIVDKNGYRFKDNTFINSIVAVFPDLIFNPEYSNEENFAIFLHEIGHNFQSAANNTTFSLGMASGLIFCWQYLIDALMHNELSHGAFNLIQNNVSKIQVLGYLYSSVSMIIYAITKCARIIKAWSRFFLMPINMILGFCEKLQDFLIDILTFRHGNDYLGERFADGFAASYGFSEALATGLQKMGKLYTAEPMLDDLLNNVPIIGHIMDLACLPGMMLLGILDCHPNVASRCYSVIADLKQDLKDPNLSPETRKQLTKEINNYEKVMHDYFDKATKLENPRMISAYVQKWIYDNGGDAKFKLSELPFMNSGGFRGETNRTAQWINQDKYNILNTKII